MGKHAGKRGDFWSKVQLGAGDACWLWQGGGRHYGMFKANGGMRYAHRLAYEKARGPIPPGLCCCHRCDEPRCVNPYHLFLGTQADNLADMCRKGRARHARGTAAGRTVLTEGQVQEIRRLAGSGTPKAHVARRYGVGASTVSAVVKGVTWQHLPWPEGTAPEASGGRETVDG